MPHLGREVHDLAAALNAVLDRWPRNKAAALDHDAQAVLADCERLADGVETLLEPDHESPGERAGGAARPRRPERDGLSLGKRAAQSARRRDGDMTPGTKGDRGASTLVDDARNAAERRRGRWS